MRSLVATCNHTKLLQYYWLHSLSYTFLGFISFITQSSYFLIFLTHFTLSPTPSPLASTSLFSVSMNLFLFCYVCLSVLFLDTTYKWNKQYLSLLAWLISLSIISSRSIHAFANGKILFALSFTDLFYYFLVSISFTSALIFIISFLLLILLFFF